MTRFPMAQRSRAVEFGEIDARSMPTFGPLDDGARSSPVAIQAGIVARAPDVFLKGISERVKVAQRHAHSRGP